MSLLGWAKENAFSQYPTLPHKVTVQVPLDQHVYEVYWENIKVAHIPYTASSVQIKKIGDDLLVMYVDDGKSKMVVCDISAFLYANTEDKFWAKL